MDETTLDCHHLDEFVTACRDRSVTKVMIAWQDEWAQTPQPGTVDYARQRRTTLLAYDHGCLLRVETGLSRSQAEAACSAAGLAWEARSRNLTR
jgi:hypothetical protein